jgi:hypothetical protein
VLSIIELKTATLDYGIPGVSQTHMLAIFLLALAVPMIPFLFLYLSLLDKKSRVKTIAWMHSHRHPQMLPH